MLNRKLVLPLLLFIHLISINRLYSQSSNEKLDDFFINKMQKSGIVGIQAAYLKNGELTWCASYGYKHIEAETRVNDSTLFMIASCSKPVTALALLKLSEQGKLDFDADINNYLPFAIINPYFPEEKITTQMLLAHTSSLQDNWDIMEPLYTVEGGGDSPIKLEDYVKDYFTPEGWYYDKENNFFEIPPGKYWSYCNMGYTLAGYLIEQISGKTFSEYMHEEIFTPLGMNNSYWFLSEIPHENIASPHDLPDRNSDTAKYKIYPHYGYPDFPDGQLRTTVSDYGMFVSVLLNKGTVNDSEFLKEETVEMFFEIQFPDINKWQAVAWNYNEFDSWLYYRFMPRLPSHTGGDPGVATVVSLNPEEKTAAIVFLNSPPNTFKGGKIFYFDMVKRLLEEAK